MFWMIVDLRYMFILSLSSSLFFFILSLSLYLVLIHSCQSCNGYYLITDGHGLIAYLFSLQKHFGWFAVTCYLPCALRYFGWFVHLVGYMLWAASPRVLSGGVLCIWLGVLGVVTRLCMPFLFFYFCTLLLVLSLSPPLIQAFCMWEFGVFVYCARAAFCATWRPGWD